MAKATKRWIKRCIKSAVRTAGAVAPYRLHGSRILTYHSVGARDHEMNVTPSAFRAQMEWLSDHVRVITLADAEQGKEGVAITFDDGYADNLTEAAPVLNAFGFSATVFMVAGKAGEVLPHDDPCEAARLMTWDEVRELHARGIEIGAHSMTHARLASLDESEQRNEIAGSVKRIQDELDRPVRAFAYPYGTAMDYDAASMRLVEEAGCRRAVSNRYGTNLPGIDRWQLRRIWIDQSDDHETFAAKVDGRLDALAALDSGIGLALRRGLNRTLGT